ncbi:prolyl aminopeptidase [Streptomyces sp. NPDC090025]|uniref:prolyl aminopeptidase n=1 Tax=Streptomyces sp. NPDC090025 TaxID=3365922 RepID=UPI003836D805
MPTPPTPLPAAAPAPALIPFPELAPYAEGMLDVGDGHHVHWSVAGNPDGKPALVVHGGPGSGSSPGSRRLFDPERYRIVLFDQRGCGRSTPHASDPATDLSVNTTAHLVADMERLRRHLGIDRWLLFGGSWGATLILAYAETHPERVSEIVLASVTTTRRSETDWLYGGVRRFFPEAYERFRAGAGSGAGDGGDGGEGGDRAEDLIRAYAALLDHPDPAVRERAAADWCAWEDAVLSGENMGTPYTDRIDAARLGFVRICAHYFAHGAFLDEGVLIRDAHRLAGIPGVLVHGRFDMAGPLNTAWELARAWPDAELHVVEGAGHLGGDETLAHLMTALARFATTTADAATAHPGPHPPE